nr:ran gtpase-activating protein 1 [Quercus suber]
MSSAKSSKIFSLRGKALKLNTAEDIQQHIGPLESSSDVEEVHLEGNTIGVGAAEALAKILATKSTLRFANLADIFTGRLLSEIPQALDVLLQALLKCENLHTINLNDNAFGLNTVEPLRPFLSQHTPLQHLYLNNNGLGPAAGTLVAEALAQLAENKTKARAAGKAVPELETVVCGRNRLETGSMAAWVKAYTANNKVRVVKMVQNGIRPEGTALLIQHGLSACTQLDTLDLQDNTFTALAGRTLAAVVPSWPLLRDLGVGDCLLSARGGVALGEALAQGHNQKLEVLRLQYNEIDAKGVKALATAAEHSTALPRLRRVELNGNKFAEEEPAIEALAAVLSKRKEEHASEFAGVDEDDEEAWGIDELDELEDDEDDEEDDDDAAEDDEAEAEQETVVRDADLAESQPVAQAKDSDVDALADALGKTEIK